MLAIFCTCIFLTGGVYTPYSPCLSTPLFQLRQHDDTQSAKHQIFKLFEQL